MVSVVVYAPLSMLVPVRFSRATTVQGTSKKRITLPTSRLTESPTTISPSFSDSP